jgi:tRNA-guanine transglycosylase
MPRFTVLKQSTKSRARLGLLETAHGVIETPSFVPVATRGALRLLTHEHAYRAGTQVAIANTYHMHLTPGEDVVAQHGGLHRFMHWDKPLFTDSGGFQVFSLGFGEDHGVGKILKERPNEMLDKDAAPKKVRMTEDGVHFASPRDGSMLFLSPEISIGIQEKLGADMIFAFDECPSPLAGREYLEQSVARTHRWAQRCIDAHTRTDQALYGIVQGGAHADLREQSARIIGAMECDGFGIGGEFGYGKDDMADMLARVADILPPDKPRHLLGVGHPEDFVHIVQNGMDTFDCIAPTHYARHGTAFTSAGRLDLRKPDLLESERPIDETCTCYACTMHTRAYVAHLIRAHDHTGHVLASIHNVHFLNNLATQLRTKIKNDEL